MTTGRKLLTNPFDNIPTKLSTNISRRPSAAEKIKDELRSVSGWFLNVTTTSSKPVNEILDQLLAVLAECRVEYKQESPFSLICEANMNALPATTKIERKDEDESMDDVEQAEQSAAMAATQSWFKGKPQMVTFQIEICQVPRMSLHGLHFKRLTGGVWNYKKVCNKILSQMTL
jgi:Kinase associated domain 1